MKKLRLALALATMPLLPVARPEDLGVDEPLEQAAITPNGDTRRERRAAARAEAKRLKRAMRQTGMSLLEALLAVAITAGGAIYTLSMADLASKEVDTLNAAAAQNHARISAILHPAAVAEPQQEEAE